MSRMFIEPKDIKKAIREQRNARSAGSSGPCLFNLVIYSKEGYLDEKKKKTAGHILAKFPSQVIFMTEFEKKNEGFLRAYVSEIKTSENNGITYDIINIEHTRSHIDRLPSILLAQLYADRPLLIVWAIDPSELSPMTLRLENYNPKIIFDSETTSNLSEFAVKLRDLHDHFHYEIADLNWARLSSIWNNILSHVFNNEEKLKAFREAKEIRILYAVSPTMPIANCKIQSVYLLSYIASVFCWKFESTIGTGDEMRFKYSSPSGPVIITIGASQRSNITTGRIVQLDITAGDEHFSFERTTSSPNQVKITRSKGNFCELAAYFQISPEISGKSLMSEMYTAGTDPRLLITLDQIQHACTGSEVCNG